MGHPTVSSRFRTTPRPAAARLHTGAPSDATLAIALPAGACDRATPVDAAPTIRANHAASLAGPFIGSRTTGRIRRITFLRAVQGLLGQEDLKTTMIDTHVLRTLGQGRFGVRSLADRR